jgi:DNA polymerase III epsilon subunit-like protein
VQLVLDLFAPPPEGVSGDRPGTALLRISAPVPTGYAVFDCETTGTDATTDEIVSFAVLRLDPDGVEVGRLTSLVKPIGEIPAEATAVHGIAAADVVGAPTFADCAGDLRAFLADTVFVAHNAGFDLPMLQSAFARMGIEYVPAARACTLEASRLLEPLADNHRLQSICERRGIVLCDAHEALSDVLATAELLRVVLAKGIAPESVELDESAYMRLRARGDTRPASEPQVRRLFGLARAAGFRLPDGRVDRSKTLAFVEHITGVADVDALTRADVQDVYDALEERTARNGEVGAAALA